MRRTVLAVGLVLAAVNTAGAQTLVISQNKCVFSRTAEIRAFADSAWTPIVQQLVDEGKLIGFQSAFHAWGDEWNVVYVYQAKSISAFLTAFGELYTRLNQRYPDVMQATADWCFEHKDSFYSMGKAAVPAPAGSPPPK